MDSTTVRISQRTHQRLRELSKRSGEPVGMVVEHAVEALRRERFFDQMDAAFADVQADAIARTEVAADRSAWETTLGDGLGIE